LYSERPAKVQLLSSDGLRAKCTISLGWHMQESKSSRMVIYFQYSLFKNQYTPKV
jgi:hypothetical protein